MGVKIKERPDGSGIWWLFIDHKGKRKADRYADLFAGQGAGVKASAFFYFEIIFSPTAYIVLTRSFPIKKGHDF